MTFIVITEVLVNDIGEFIPFRFKSYKSMEKKQKHCKHENKYKICMKGFFYPNMS